MSEILETANKLVNGPRREAYSHPKYNFKATGRGWGAILEAWLNTTHPGIQIPDVPPRIVGLMMVHVKVAREANRHTHDNLVDIVGYTLCNEMIEEDEEPNAGTDR